MIQLKKVSKIYQSSGGEVQALKDVDITIAQGESVFVIGRSGSGKSTLLNVISGLDNCDSGTVQVHDTCLNGLSENQLAKWRGQNIGIVFQFYQLLPTLSTIDNVVIAMDLVDKVPRSERKSRAIDLLSQVGLCDKAKKYPNELSGGEKQRVAIARSLANDPKIIIADEPTGNLDSRNGEMVYDIFQKLNQTGKTIIVVTHENITEKRFTQAIHIQDGTVKEIKRPV